MKKLYDEIIELKNYKHCYPEYDDGFDDGLDAAAKLAKKYDDRISALEKSLSYTTQSEKTTK